MSPQRPNEITGANAGGPHRLAVRTRWAARIAQFGRSAEKMNSGIGAILIGDSRGVAKLSERISPAELIEALNRVTTALMAVVERNSGTVHQYVGGSLIAYWPPEKMPAAARDPIAAAADAIVACGETVAVSVAVGGRCACR
jgi:class 3 adenylate cyclase